MAKIDLDTEVVVQNNRVGIFYYNDGRGSTIELSEYGDTEYATMRTLKTLSTGRDKGFLKNFSLLVVDVNDEEVELDDVLKELRLTEIYGKAKKDLGVDDITSEDFNSSINDIKLDKLDTLLANPNLRSVVSEILIEKYKQEKVSPGVVEHMLSERGVANPYEFMEDIRKLVTYKK